MSLEGEVNRCHGEGGGLACTLFSAEHGFYSFPSVKETEVLEAHGIPDQSCLFDINRTSRLQNGEPHGLSSPQLFYLETIAIVLVPRVSGDRKI